MSQKFYAGFDLGSRTSKIVLFHSNKIVYNHVTDTGINPRKTANRLLGDALKSINLHKSDISQIYATGYGRNILDIADKQISEISCHARGVGFLFPNVRTIIDIGGQDSKVILLNSQRKVIHFIMNDKCAAGTGRFLEVVANILDITIDDLGKLSLNSKKVLEINSTCVVFAESEIIGLISQGEEAADIINSVHVSIAKRTRNLIAQMHWRKPIVFTGGVAKNTGMQDVLSQILQTKMVVPENPFITGALGAAIFAAES